MNIKWVLLAISVVTFLGPMGAALVIYRDNLATLVVPETPEFMTVAPEIEYVGYQIIDPLKPPSLKFKIANPYSINLRLNSISAKVFCSDHDTLLGFANETGSINIPAKSPAIISLVLTFTSEGDMHIITNHLGKNDFYVDLRGLALDIQGIKLRYEEQISRVGPIPIPTP